MTLRIMLVGLVASMGFELPSGPDLSRWTRSGRDWVHARLSDLSGPALGTCRPEAELTDCRQANASDPMETPDDKEFATVSETMAVEFAADLMTMRDGQSPGEDIQETLAGELPAVGLPEGEEQAFVASLVVEPQQTEVVESDDAPGVATTLTGTPTARVDEAVRLTREAIRAWAILMEESPDEGCSSR